MERHQTPSSHQKWTCQAHLPLPIFFERTPVLIISIFLARTPVLSFSHFLCKDSGLDPPIFFARTPVALFSFSLRGPSSHIMWRTPLTRDPSSHGKWTTFHNPLLHIFYDPTCMGTLLYTGPHIFRPESVFMIWFAWDPSDPKNFANGSDFIFAPL